MEDWERAFRDQSERRRRKARRRRRIRTAWVLSGIMGAVLAALWLINL